MTFDLVKLDCDLPLSLILRIMLCMLSVSKLSFV